MTMLSKLELGKLAYVIGPDSKNRRVRALLFRYSQQNTRKPIDYTGLEPKHLGVKSEL